MTTTRSPQCEMADSTFKLKIGVPKQLVLDRRKQDREYFYSWVWQHFLSKGLLGIHEGTMLAEEAAEVGHETESWLCAVDAAEAPRDRDWIADQKIEIAELFFEGLKQAQSAREFLSEVSGLKIGEIEEEKPRDWNAEWKASFKGAEVPPFWKVIPPWEKSIANVHGVIRINPGAGFGTGTHETTQLCLKVLGELSIQSTFEGLKVLDFGSGSGILSVAAASLGAKVDAVEVDPLANENAFENAKLNVLEKQIQIGEKLKNGTYDLIVANILKPILLEFSEELTKRLKSHGTLILSGLIEKDVKEVSQQYSALLGRESFQVHELNEWRAILFKSLK